MKVWVVLEEDRGLGPWAEVFSSKERAEVYGKGKAQIYETEIDEEYNALDPGDKKIAEHAKVKVK